MINEVKQALGSWDLKLSPATPRGLLDAITPFGHLAIIPGRVNPKLYGDTLLRAARYVGVYRRRDAQDEYTLYGASMAFWLGDEDNKGDVFEWDNRVVAASASFANTIRMLLPESGAVTEGTLFAVPGSGTYSGTHVWQTPRTAISYVCDIFSTEAQPVEWRANGDGTLDAGPINQLYIVDTPKALLTKKPGRDLFHVGLPVRGRLGTDVEDYSTRVVVLGEGLGGSIALGAANALAVPYKDIHGGTVKMTRMVSSSTTDGSNTATVAQLQLGLFSNPKYTVDLSTGGYDIHGDVAVGDYVLVHDPDNGFTDPAREIYWEGQPINPIALRCVEMSWPVTDGYTVAYRDYSGVWWDLTDYYVPEDGDARIVVGEFNRSVAGIGTEPLGTRPVGDSSVPAAPVFTGFSAGVYQSGETNTTKSAIRAQWSEPLNTNGSTVLDGDHYEIRYRVSAIIGYQVDWDFLADEGYTWDDLGSWDGLISEPVQADPQWQTLVIGWNTESATILELTPGVTYEIQIRAVDSATPPNFSAWSPSEFVTTTGDLIAPSTPAAPGTSPNIIASSRIAIQITHFLGKNSGGTFNLEQDLDHLNIHVGGSDSFFCDETNKVGELIATAGMLQANIPAVGTYQVEQTDTVWVKVVAVDRAGNKSDASPASQATALLIDDAHIDSLTVSKVTAGTITAQWLMAGTIKTADSGRRVTIESDGINLWNDEGASTIEMHGDSGIIEFFEEIPNSGGFKWSDSVLRLGSQVGPDDDLYGFEVRDIAGSTKALIGKLRASSSFSGDDYGIALVNDAGELTVLRDFVFGPQTDEVTSRQSTASGSYTDLSTVGPEVSLTIGETGRCMVVVGAFIETNAPSGSAIDTGSGYMGFEMSGANSSGANDQRAAGVEFRYTMSAGSSTAGYDARVACSRVVFLTSLDPGNTTFTAKYRSDGSGSSFFSNRQIAVFPY